MTAIIHIFTYFDICDRYFTYCDKRILFRTGMIMKKNYYATPEMVKGYLKKLSGKCRMMPEFPETLMMMKEEGLLSEKTLPLPVITGFMSKEDFMAAYDRIPFEVNRIFDVLWEEHEKNRNINLPDDVDVASAQHIHNYGYTKQTLNNVFSFTYIFRGSCTLSFDDQEIRLDPGDIYIASPGFEHSVHTTPDTFAIVVVVRSAAFEILFHDFLTSDLILSEFFRKYIVEKTAGNYCVIRGNPDDDEVRFYIQSLACENADKQKYYFNSCSVSLLKLFLATAFRKYHDNMSFYQQNFSSGRPDAAEIYQFIQMNYQDITLEKLAANYHFNRTYVSRYIHEHFSRTFSDIVTGLKIDHAKEYLRKTNKSVTEISALVGYESLNHFSKTFKKCTGMSAMQYRASSSGGFSVS